MAKEPRAAFSLLDCLKYANETKELVIKKDALEEVPRILSKYYEFDSLCFIADENTFKAAGQKLKTILESAGLKISGIHVFPGEPRLHADYVHVRFITEWITSLRAFPNIVPVSIGAGTINDLVKRASDELKLPYLCVPTAASVDGYTPNGAALLMDGFKQTLPCTAPLALAADTDVIAQAPAYLSSSGFGDLAGKITAGTDWLIAEKAGVLGAPQAPAVDPLAWSMVQDGLMDALNRSVNAAKGDREAVNALFQSLAITGFSMQYMKSSRPVSGSEHLWSHIWEMDDLSVNGIPVTHGHKVAIGTLAATAFTETFFADPKGPPAREKTYRRPSRDERKAEVSTAFKGSKAQGMAIAVAVEKIMDEKTAETISQDFRDTYREIRDRVLERLLPYGELKSLFARAGCPVRPEVVGLGRNETIATARRAQMIRNRYTILDIAWDMGIYSTLLEKMEKSDIHLR
jgi:glycerol-1-phosphate dehydrogenase [NAD(P)+]